jgi:hypothetical protein
MTFHKTLYIITNLAGIGAITGLFGAISYSSYSNYSRKISDNFTILAVASSCVLLLSPFVSNLADVVLYK